MESSKIKPEDIGVLIRVLNIPGEVVIYDPSKTIIATEYTLIQDITRLLKSKNQYQVCINLSGKPMEVLSFEHIVEIGTSTKGYASFSNEKLLCFNNPDGTIRWLQPARCKTPCFLNLYNGSGVKASVFRFVSRIVSKVGLNSLIFHNQINLHSKQKDYLSNKMGSKDFALFTGTVGPNRKAVAVFSHTEGKQYFIKIPITERAKQLIQSEQEHLLYLRQFGLQKLNIPKAKMKTTGLELTDVRPDDVEPNLKITVTHIAALTELYEYTFHYKSLKELSVYKATVERLKSLESLKNSEKADKKFQLLLKDINKLFDRINAHQIVPIAYAHGDFTPWNMFLEKDRINLYDWELAMSQQYMLYDLFHFVFQTGVLVLHQPFEQIKKSLEQLKQNLEQSGLLQRYKIDFENALYWYLTHNCSYYLDLYTRQKYLHKQAWWLIDCWSKALTEALLFMSEKAIEYKAVPQK